MKVRMISTMAIRGGGITSYVGRLVEPMRAGGDSVRIQAERDAPFTQFGQHSYVEPIWTHDVRYPFQNFRAVRRDSDYDVVHVQHEFWLFGGPATALLFPLLLLLLRLRGTPVITTIHGVIPKDALARVREGAPVGGPLWVARAAVSAVTRLILWFSTAVIVHDTFFRDALVNEYGGRPDKIVVIPHGVDARLPRVPKAEARTHLGLGPEPMVLSMGYLAAYKGLEGLIDAFNLLGPRDPDLRLVIAGGPPARNSANGAEYVQRLQGRVAPGLAPRVRFTGFVEEPQVADYFGAADLVVCSHVVPLASSGILALAQGYGVPVIAPAIPPFTHILSQPDALFPVDAPVAMAETIERFIHDPGALERLAQASEAEARERDWPVIARRHHELYARLVPP
ncbi:MAG: glycosyltransferase family 4 protein [Thermoplasmata archaeon]